MASKVASRKDKARRQQKRVAAWLRGLWPKQLTEHDVKEVPLGTPGIDIRLSQIARKLFPLAIECKNQESIRLWEAIKQAKVNAEKEGLKPALVFARNRHEDWIAMSLEDFGDLIHYYEDRDHYPESS